MSDEKKETKKIPKPEPIELSVYEKLKMEFRSDSQKAEMRIGQLDRMIPRLQEEKQQLIGMLNVMQRVLEEDEEDEEGKQDESKNNGSEQDSNKKSGNGSN